MISRRLLATLLAGALLTPGLAAHAETTDTWCDRRCDRVITDWNATATLVIHAGEGHADPLAASRSLAMMHVAMHDAVNTVHPRYGRYSLGERPTEPHRADAAVAASLAAHDVLMALYSQPAAQAIAHAQLERTLTEAGPGTTIDAGARIGRAAAAAVLARRAVEGDKPFVLVSAMQFRTAAVTHRIPDETPMGWNRVARAASGSHEQDLWDRARTFALLNMAMADAGIAVAGTPATPGALGAAAVMVLTHAYGNDHATVWLATEDAGLEPGRSIGQYVNRHALPRQYGDGSFDH
jgi:hypothetical protein